MVKHIIAVILLIMPFLLSAERIIVRKIESLEVQEPVRAAIEETLVLEIGKRKDLSVTSEQELDDTIAYASVKRSLRCPESEECIVELRRKMKADTLITGKLAVIAGELILSLTAIDMNSGEINARITVQEKDLSSLKKAIPDAVDGIIGKKGQKSGFTLPEGSSLKLAVMPLTSSGVPNSLSDTLTQIMNSELGRIEGISVISQDDLKAIISKTEMDASLRCRDTVSCLVEIGASFGASILVTGSVGKIGNMYVISVKLIDVRQGEILSRIVESFEGKEHQLKHAIKIVVMNLVGIDYSKFKGKVDFTINTDDAEFSIAGEKSSTENGTLRKENILPGRYLLKVRSEDYFPFQTDVYITPDTINTAYFELIKKPTPWYRTWWFWTVTGVVVAGAATATVYAITSQEKYATGEAKNPK